MVLGKLSVPGVVLIWIIAGQGPTALAVGEGGGCSDVFSLICHFFLFLPLGKIFYLKYCLKGATKSKTTNQPILISVRLVGMDEI